MNLEKFLQLKYNYNPDKKDEIQTYIDQWFSWYRGNVRDFHNYFIFNGNKQVPQKRYTMNMAKEIAEYWSDIIWSEKCEINFKDDETNNNFEQLTDQLDLYSVINQLIERAGALGTSAAVVSVYDLKTNSNHTVLDTSTAKSRVDIVSVNDIYPLSWDNKQITECAFSSSMHKNGKNYVVLSVHKLNSNHKYVIYNHLFEQSNDNLIEITNGNDTASVFNTQSDIKWFSIFKPLLTNNLFDNSCFGIPYYANAIDNLKAVDISFDALKNEIKDGRRRTFVRADMFNYDDGQQKLVFDPNDTTVYQLPNGATKDDLIQTEGDELRTGSILETLKANLNTLGDKCGLGENHFHFDGQTLSTATAVISSNSKLFRRKKKLEIGYESSIYDLVKAICYASSKFGKYKLNYDEIVIKFDDSIIEDKEAESNRAMREVSAQLLSKVEYREKIFGETTEIAKKKIDQIASENEQLNIDNAFNEQSDEDEQKEEK